jgi:hypothetical protein
MRTFLAAAVLVLAVVPGHARQAKPAQNRPKVDQVKVDAAIAKGVAYLRSVVGGPIAPQAVGASKGSQGDLVLWTLLHAGVLEADPLFQALLKDMLGRELTSTYCVSLQAMILEELDRVKHQDRIYQCAQFLVDNQCKNGTWSYGEPSSFAKETPTGGPPPTTASAGGKKQAALPIGKRVKPKVVRRIAVKKMKEGIEAGDNSNSQYAALGLRACHDAGIVLPEEVLARAEKWWRDSQDVVPPEQTGPGAAGWCYGHVHRAKDGGHDAYGSMTAGAAGSLAIYRYVRGLPWKNDVAVVRGLEWLDRYWNVTENPRVNGFVNELGSERVNNHFYYYLYALERAAVLYDTDTIGKHDWYAEGAQQLIDSQEANGSWRRNGNPGWEMADSCFAILFLRRATRPFKDVASVDRYADKK